MFKTLLIPQFSADGRWASVLAEYTRVAADVVALDSELPLKSRDAIETASGSIPKMGMKVALTEKTMKDIDNMIASNLPLAQIIQKIFADMPRCIEGVWERIEDLFLSELSTGVGVSANNNGTGIRVDMNYYEDHLFFASSDWTQEDATPLDDIQKLVDKSIDDQNLLTDAYLDDIALKALYQNKQVRNMFAFNSGIAVVDGGNNVPILDFEKVADIFNRKWGVQLHRVARKVKTEINGNKQNHSPWKKGMIVFVCDEQLGSLVWTNTAEMTRPAPQAQYQTVDEYLLVSKFSKQDPLVEVTSSQAMVLPVLNNVDRIYTLDSQTIAA